LILFVLLLSAIVFLALAAYTYRYLAVRYYPSKLFLKDAPQIWAHRGYHKGIQENSLEAFKMAFQTGVKGIELDTHYDKSLDRFVVSHDAPYQKHKGKLLFLENLFQAFGNTGYYWVDLKNLSLENREEVSLRMRILLDKFELDEHVFIESWRGDPLSELSNQGFQTLYWINLNHEEGTLDHLGELHRRRGMLIKSNFTALSGDYRTFLRYPPDVLDNYPLFVFTINDPAILERFRTNPRVKVILTDEPYFYQTSNGNSK
jgi:glycerophosphoryl diester phosphodiesterase